jgi:ActR/RegA family two-component response regulator
MRALLVEDDALRGRALKRALVSKGYEVAWVFTVASAIAELRATADHGDRFAFATLDYNLGAGSFGDELALWLTTVPEELRPERIEVHSSDDDGAARMITVLESGGIHATRAALS